MASVKTSQLNSQSSLRDYFLIAMPGLTDSIFAHSVTYICDHNKHGAMGIVINQTLDVTIEDIFEQLSLSPATPQRKSPPILAGGPLNIQQGFVLHRGEGHWDSTLQISDEVYLTASKDIVAAIADNHGPQGAQFALGYAGWSPGQLEEEISANSWLTIPADTGIIFDTPVDERWAAASKYVGIDLNLISPSVGHA